MTAPITVSYSQIQSIRKCEQDYAYGYIDKLRPKVRFAPMELGTVIHRFFETYYRLLRAGREDAAYRKAIKAVLGDARAETRSMARIAKAAGNDDAASALLAIPDTAEALMAAYHRVHGQHDATTHRVVFTEEEFSYRLAGGVRLNGVIDMVTEDERGFWLWEHKTTQNVPSVRARLRDLQVALYAPVVKQIVGVEPAGIIWNNIHTTRPRPPALLKNGKMSVAQCITTLELVEAVIAQAEPNDDQYHAFVQRVHDREREMMFPRYELALGQNTALLLHDARRTARRIERAQRRGRAWHPVRTIAAHCDWCTFLPLCQGVIAGGDDEVIRRTQYTTKEARDGKGGRRTAR